MFIHVLVDKVFFLLKEIVATQYKMLFLFHEMKCNCLARSLQEHFVTKEKYIVQSTVFNDTIS